jgi:nicotinate-nucleotide pyrophosphorylase (carboxylating)
LNNKAFIEAALAEDIGSGDYSTLACIPPNAGGKAVLKVKEAGVLAGMKLAEEIIKTVEPNAIFTAFIPDGAEIGVGDIAMEIEASVHTLLKTERLLLNCMQRMSGIATLTRRYTNLLSGYKTRLLDTRKTTPLFRKFEKEAVLIGGGVNHRMGLYDMVMLKDNHIDFCGGIEKALVSTHNWLISNNLSIKIEVETRTLADVETVLKTGLAHRIMFDNFTPNQVAVAMEKVAGTVETEASGGITLENIRDYAETGVDFVSSGAIIHHAVSLDLSLKAKIL